MTVVVETHVRVVPAPDWERPDLTVTEWVQRAKTVLRTDVEDGPEIALATLLYAAGMDEDAALRRARRAVLTATVDVLLGEVAA